MNIQLISDKIRIDRQTCFHSVKYYLSCISILCLSFRNWYILGILTSSAPEKAMAPHSSTLAWKIPWTEEPRGLQSMGSLRVGHDWATSFSLSCIGDRNGNPLQCSCLENPRDGGVWWAAVYGVAQNWTWLKQLSSSSILCLSYQFSSVAPLCLTLCDPMNRSTPGLPVHHQLPKFTQTHVHWVSDAT